MQQEVTIETPQNETHFGFVRRISRPAGTTELMVREIQVKKIPLVSLLWRCQFILLFCNIKAGIGGPTIVPARKPTHPGTLERAQSVFQLRSVKRYDSVTSRDRLDKTDIEGLPNLRLQDW